MRPHQLVHVRVVGRRDAQIGGRTHLPVFLDGVAVQAAQLETLHVNARVHDEARAQDHAVQRARLAILRDDAGGRELADVIRHQLHVRAVEGGEPLVGDQDALAAQGVVGRQLLDQRRVLHLPADELLQKELTHLGQRGVEDGPHTRLVGPVAAPAVQRAREGQGGEHLLAEGRVRTLVTRDHPGRRALEHVQLLHLGRDLRHVLNRRAARADRRHALVAQVIAVVPLRRVHHLALELVQPLDLRDGRHMQRPRSQHPMAADVGVAPGRLHRPAARALVEHRAHHLLLQADLRAQAVLLGHVQDVLLDLVPRRVALGPLRAGRKRVRVHVRLHIAGRAGVLVVTPGAAHVVPLFQDHEIGDARLLQLDGHAQATETGARNGHLDMVDLGGGGDLIGHAAPRWKL